MDNMYVHYAVLIVGTFIVVWTISFILRKVLDFFIKRNSEQLLVDPTNFIFLKNSISLICFSVGLFWIFTKIPYFHSLGTALFASAGVLAAIIGLASQKAFANIIGGVFILIFKPFRIGDAIELANGHKGVVEEITLRHTVIKDYEFQRIVIPNSIMSDDPIINSSITDRKIRKHIDIGIAYDADLKLAEDIIEQLISEHPMALDTRSMAEQKSGVRKVPVKVIELGDYSITLRAFVWTENFETSIDLKRDVLRSIKMAFDENGVEIPFPYRTLVFKNKPNDLTSDTSKSDN